MSLQKQLSIFTANRPGALARVCSVLSENNINLEALSIHDAVDHALVRIIVEEPTKASLLLESEEFYVLEHDVVVIEMENRPGTLTRFLQSLAEADINVQYSYCTGAPNEDSCLLVLKTDEPDRAEEILSR